MLISNTVEGIFKEELKNRFLCTVEINGLDVMCYVPSSCRLSNFINLSNQTVLLQPNNKMNARTKYSLFAVKYKKNLIPINLSSANRIVESDIRRKIFSFLGKRKTVLREKIIDFYKCDLYIQDTDTVIEIKSILSISSEALFPTVISQRSILQLEKIKNLLKDGHKVYYIFVSMYSGVDLIRINHEQTKYFKLFNECVTMGMKIYGFTIKMCKGGVFIKSSISLVL